MVATEKPEVQLKGQPHPFKAQTVTNLFQPGLTIEEMLLEAGFRPDRDTLVVQLDDQVIERDVWGAVRPKPGTRLAVKSVPQGEGGGDKVLATVAFLAVAAFAGPAAGFITGATKGTMIHQFASAGIRLAGALAASQLVSPTSPERFQSQASREGPMPQITGTQNRLNPFGPVPIVLGKHQMYPPLAAEPVSEVEGDDQYFRQLFCPGYGPVKFSGKRIGKTDLSNYDGVTIEEREGRTGDSDVTIFADSVSTDQFGVTLDTDWTVRTTDQDIDEIGIDIAFPQGVAEFQDDGGRTTNTVTIEVEYSPAGDDNWSDLHTFNITENFPNRFLRGTTQNVTRGQYDVRLRRSTEEADDTQILETVDWAAMRNIVDEDPIQADINFAEIALKIKATDQLSGVVDQFNLLVESEVLDWDSDTDTWTQRTTSNPASLYRHVLQSDANVEPKDDSEIDLTKLQEWHEFCDDKSLEYNAVVDFEGPVYEILKEIAAAGRAAPNEIDGQQTVVIDREKTGIAQHFTPRNSRNFEAEKQFRRQPDALRIQFANEDKDYKQDERIVYADGESEATATEFETMEFHGVTDPEQIWKMARWTMGMNELRPEQFRIETDIEHMVATRGDKIRVSHDVPLIGSDWGRVTELITDGSGNITHVRVDEELEKPTGEDLVARFRLNDGTSLVEDVS